MHGTIVYHRPFLASHWTKYCIPGSFTSLATVFLKFGAHCNASTLGTISRLRWFLAVGNGILGGFVQAITYKGF